MKKFKYLTILTLCITSNYILAQISQDWKFQSAGYIIEGYTTDNPNDYIWYEESNISQGVHISVLPAEKFQIFIEQSNNYICFNTFLSPTWGYEFIVNIDVNINNNGYNNLYNGNPTWSVVWYNSSNVFSTLGSYNLKVKIQEAMGTEYFREYEIKVIPSSDKLYKDNYGNSLRKWEGNNPENNIPVVFSEGFDAYDTNPQQMYYYAASDLITCMRDNGFDIYLLDNIYGTQDIRNNAAGFSAAVQYISELNGDQLIIAGGVSMGGMIARYALAKAENDGNSLPVYSFISVDSPQQGAIISQPLQNYKKEHTEGDAFAEHALNNDAAKQLLNYCTYDPSGSIHNAFYAELNSLNGDGYPHQTKNIGVSFSTNSPNPNSGIWLTIVGEPGWPFSPEEESFELTTEEKVAGSYLPVDLTTTAPFIMRAYAWYWNFLIQPWNYPVITITRTNDPAYISYESALDIVNGESKFDVTIKPSYTTYHDILPDELVDPIVNELIFNDIYIQNITIQDHTQYYGNKVNIGEAVTPLLPFGAVMVLSNASMTVDAKEEIHIYEGFSAELGAECNFNVLKSLNVSCNNFERKNSDNDLFFNHADMKVISMKNNSLMNNNSVSPLIFPNPSNGIFYIENINICSKLEVKGQLGDVYIKKNRFSTNPVIIDLTKYSNGIYLLYLYQDDQVFVFKLIKQ